MTPWLDDGDVRLYHGDCLQVLRQLPDQSVHMCATSPPFYGLRDYGTGEWEGGDEGCDHKRMETRAPHERKSSTLDGGTDTIRIQEEASAAYRTVCGKCGARRVDQQIGLEETPDQWVDRLVAVFREVRRVLRDDATCWIELGDSFSNKQLVGQPWQLAFALQRDGWFLRSEIIWSRLRPNPMPESVTDRPTKAHSTVFLLSKRPRYFMDMDAIREPHTAGNTQRQLTPSKKMEMAPPDRSGAGGRSQRPPVMNVGERQYLHPAGRNAHSVWVIPTEPTPFAHFATWPQALVRRMILAGTSERGCCPECGAPWVRQTERELVATRGAVRSGAERGDGERDLDLGRGEQWAHTGGVYGRYETETLGWSSSCACACTRNGVVDQPWTPVPCTVLDPFSGSGTTSLVARNHGRHSVGIELNADYLNIAATRLQQLSLLSAAGRPGTGET